jgi:hypothetical protein
MMTGPKPVQKPHPPILVGGAKENLDLLKRDPDDGVSRLVVSLDSR